MSNTIPNMNLPVKTGDDFVGELETMDISALKGQMYIVAPSMGDRNEVKVISSGIRGPFTFEEMCEVVGTMWKEHQHHAKAIVLQKDPHAAPLFLDENTIDYIEAHFQDIIVESMLGGAFDEVKDYTCRAEIAVGDGSDNPLDAKNIAAKEAAKEKVEDEEDDQL